MKKEQFNVLGMTCSACSANVAAAVKKLNGVSDVNVSLLSREMTVTYEESSIEPSMIISAVNRIGYNASYKNADAEGKGKNGFKMQWNKRKEESQKEKAELKKRMIYSLCFLAALMYISMGSMWGLALPWILDSHENTAIWAFTQFLLSLPVIFINRKFFTVGFKALYHLKPNMDSLVATGSGASLVYGIFALYRIMFSLSQGDMETVMHYSHQLYFESAAMILALVTLGKFLEANSKGKTSDALEKLVNLAPKTARILVGNEEKTISAEDIKVGDTIVIRPGESVPADGVITEGRGFLDEASITGESLPVEKGEGDSVITATINKNGSFKMTAAKVGDDTTLAQIVRLVDEAGNSKAPIARLADKVSLWFVPAVIFVSAITFCVWLALGEGFEFAFSCAVSVLVISCPCALGLATPVAIMVGTGKAAELGILIKSAQSLETLSKINTVVLDKTGTITKGMPAVTDISLIKKEIAEKEFLQIAYSIENQSEHPLALAVAVKAKALGLIPNAAEEFLSISGKGAQAKINGQNYYTGNVKFIKEVLKDRKIKFEKTIALAEKYAQAGKTPLIFTDEKEVLGIIAVADTVKPSSPYAIKLLKEMGKKVVMLTGDNSITANAIGKQVGIENVISEVLPADKERCVKKEQEGENMVAMVGDGINDAPALTRADVGIAVGKGTDIAIDSADVVLMKDSLYDIATAFKLSTAVIKNIKMNLFWAFFYNICFIPVASGVFYYSFNLRLNPMLGALAMSLSSVCVVTNALRLRFFKEENKNQASEPKENKIEIEKESKNTMTKTLTVEGMMCAHCVSHVETALKKLNGVENAEVSLESKKAVVYLTEPVPDEILINAVKEAGYEVKSAE